VLWQGLYYNNREYQLKFLRIGAQFNGLSNTAPMIIILKLAEEGIYG